MKVTPDSTHRIVLTREMRDALNLRPGEPVEISIAPGILFLSAVPSSEGKIVRKGKLKVYTGKIPDIDVEKAVQKARHYTRL
jgi:bifunctional DNA-binding transcriptional regulator/antitoxin component of YhaV-PrlF toxin-antitoxin module